ncbi:hypothetical protein EXIGLDRAFT_299322 [Exidia glandulosa HHB12029]|uniref:Uncharacterized protein n=1 Tax=Exidia glandulosa HHB12029 TaxID=1314781 RepID=A0A165DAC5_EXIGL|nr:hypothetical protein EXIGLDRAFT_299322 [Exidia glandulosa HHB12029]
MLQFVLALCLEFFIPSTTRHRHTFVNSRPWFFLGISCSIALDFYNTRPLTSRHHLSGFIPRVRFAHSTHSTGYSCLRRNVSGAVFSQSLRCPIDQSSFGLSGAERDARLVSVRVSTCISRTLWCEGPINRSHIRQHYASAASAMSVMLDQSDQ